MLYPEPSVGDTGFNSPSTIELDPGERGTVRFDPKNRVSELVLPIVAMSKHDGVIYSVRADGKDRYGPAQIPPTDVDDLGVCFLPALRFEDSLTCEVTNLGTSTRRIHIQPVGWEPGGSD